MPQDFKDRLLAAINYAKLNKSGLAERLNVSPAYISQLCSGVRTPSDRTIADICRVFGVDEVWLRTGVGEMFTPKTRIEELDEIFEAVKIGADDKSRLVRAMAKMPDKAFPEFLRFLQELGKRLEEE